MRRGRELTGYVGDVGECVHRFRISDVGETCLLSAFGMTSEGDF